jgi:Xaa-Pro aminopeptidase
MDSLCTHIDYPGRVKRLAEALSENGLDAYIGTRPGILHYFVGAFMPWSGAVIVTASGDACVYYWTMDSERVRAEAGWKIPVLDWGGEEPGFIEALALHCAENGLVSGRIGVDLVIPGSPRAAPGLLTANDHQDLAARLPDAVLVNGCGVANSLWLVKEAAEIERMRLAGVAAVAGLEAGIAALRPGISENAVAGEVERAIRLKGSTWAWSVTGGTEVGSGERTAYFRGISQQASEKLIRPGELVIIDLHPMVELYLADLGVPVMFGTPSEEQRKLIDAWQETVDFMLDNLKPGRRIAEVCTKAFPIYAKHGLGKYGLPMFGHGLGTCARQRPFLHPATDDVVLEGMTFALGAHLYQPGVGGLRLEYPTVITNTGAEPLCPFPAKVQFVSA